MAQMDLHVRYPKRFRVTTDSDHNDAISPNTLDRNFDVTAPNQVWTTDITYILTLEGWMYLACKIRLSGHRSVGFWIRLSYYI